MGIASRAHNLALLTPYIVAVSATLCLTACASRPINDPIAQVDPSSGYRPSLLVPARENNEFSTLFILSFSGGGTRAAALSYGVLEELNRVEFTTANGQKRRLIEEIDLITGVSGGSFTALAYALYGDRLFEEYEQRFLKRNVQGALARRSFLNPVNWFRLMSGNFGRSELAAEYYDEILFEGATYNDLMQKAGPVAIANGTDITTGSRLAFFQDEFDLLCSDLGTVSLSRAAATSSAVPMVLSPVTFDNYGGTCSYKYPPWVEDILKLEPNMRPMGRALERYRQMGEFSDGTNRPYIHLVDGGVSDNIGVRGVMEVFEASFISKEFAKERQLDLIRKVILIVVNARSEQPKNWQQKESPPGSIKQLIQSSGVPIERYSHETIELMKDRAEIQAWRRRMLIAEARLAGKSQEEAEAANPEVEMHVMDISFEAIEDTQERAYFMGLPTSFVLEDEAVDRLREVAARLMNQSPAYQNILGDINSANSH
jgi:NTE family protein